MKIPALGGKKIWPPFTIPSGIITVSPDLMVRAARELAIGMVTSKSIGVLARDGYREPVVSFYPPDSLSSAIGLSNPGIDAWIEEMSQVNFPQDKFLLVSIFADNADDFVLLALGVSPFCDGVELNFCCPHSLRYGAAVAEQEELTIEITRAVRNAIDKTLVVKLTPDGPDIGPWSRKLVQAGADAIAAIGPTKAVTVVDPHACVPILSYGSGGLSGPAILERGLACVREIRRYVDVPIIGGGGIRDAEDVRKYEAAGADIFSIGTCLAGMDTATLKSYFITLVEDIQNGTNKSADMVVSDWRLEFHPYRIARVSRNGDYAVLEMDSGMDAEPGQFVFCWLPGVGEKPFGVARTEPLTLGVKRVGSVSNALYNLEPGADIFVRGPFGRSYPIQENTVIVAGGCGAVPLRLLAERCPQPTIVIGGRTKDEILFLDDFLRFGNTLVATEDGSMGYHGTVVQALSALLSNGDWRNHLFCNCGPEYMMVAAAEIERRHVDTSRIFIGVERYTSCGIGLCGKCALDGYRTCVDGPVMRYSDLDQNGDFGHWRREACGRKSAI